MVSKLKPLSSRSNVAPRNYAWSPRFPATVGRTGSDPANAPSNKDLRGARASWPALDYDAGRMLPTPAPRLVLRRSQLVEQTTIRYEKKGLWHITRKVD